MSFIVFNFYRDGAGESSNTEDVNVNIFNRMACSDKIMLFTDREDIAELDVAWIVRNRCLSKRSLFDKIADFFSFLGYESTMQKVDRLYKIVKLIPIEVKI